MGSLETPFYLVIRSLAFAKTTDSIDTDFELRFRLLFNNLRFYSA